MRGGDGEFGLVGLLRNSGGVSEERENETEMDQNLPASPLRSELAAELTSAGRILHRFPTVHLPKVQLSSSLMRGAGVNADGRRCFPLNE